MMIRGSMGTMGFMGSKAIPFLDQITAGGGAPVVEQVNCREFPSARTAFGSSITAVGRAKLEWDFMRVTQRSVSFSLLYYSCGRGQLRPLHPPQNSSSSRSRRFRPARLGGSSQVGPCSDCAVRKSNNQMAAHPHSRGFPCRELQACGMGVGICSVSMWYGNQHL